MHEKKVTECCVQSTTLNVISDLQTTGFFNICVRKWECVFVDLQFAFRRYNIFHLNNHFVVWNAEKYGYVLTLRLLYFFLNKKTRFVLFDRWVLIRLVFFLLFNVVVQFQKFHSQFSLLLFKNPFDLHTFKWIIVVDKKKSKMWKSKSLFYTKCTWSNIITFNSIWRWNTSFFQF